MRARPVLPTTGCRRSQVCVLACLESPIGCWAAPPRPRTSFKTSGYAGRPQTGAWSGTPRPSWRRPRRDWRSTCASRHARGGRRTKTRYTDARERTTPAQIGQLAYHFYDTRGRQDGHDVEDWLLAEEELTRRYW